MDGHEYMISPFAPINLPVLEKSDIEVDNNIKDQHEEEEQESKEDPAENTTENQIIDRRKKQSANGTEKILGSKRQR
jgi:hypothetical protein